MIKIMEIKDIIGEPALLEQLAEEASELVQAALKLSRKLRGVNPTPKTEGELRADLVEEFTDVIHVSKELNLQVDVEQITRKRTRWLGRLGRLEGKRD